MVELQIVILAVAGSSPVDHPIFESCVSTSLARQEVAENPSRMTNAYLNVITLTDTGPGKHGFPLRKKGADRRERNFSLIVVQRFEY